MSVTSFASNEATIANSLNLPANQHINFQLAPKKLVQQIIGRGEGLLNNTGALVIATGKFTGRSPEDKFIVKDAVTIDTVDWNNFNNPVEAKYFDQLQEKIICYLSTKEVWVRDCYACADEAYQLNIRVVNVWRG